jgi:plastocyanin
VLKFKDLSIIKITKTNMNIKDLLGKFRKDNAGNQTAKPKAVAEAAVEENTEDEVSTGTKVKVIAALLVAGFASYVAWWVQEPTTMRADLFAANAATEQATSETQSANVKEVSIIDFAFDPAEITVDNGTTVVWINKDSVPHTVVGDNFNSGTLESGQSFSHTFDLAQNAIGEVYQYSCSLHPQMKGTVIVGIAGAETQAYESTQTQMTALMDTTEQAQPYAANTEGNFTLATEQLLPAASEAPAEQLQPELYVEPPVVDNKEVLAAVESQDKLAKSGPEDIVYAGMILGILFLNRKKLLPRAR